MNVSVCNTSVGDVPRKFGLFLYNLFSIRHNYRLSACCIQNNVANNTDCADCLKSVHLSLYSKLNSVISDFLCKAPGVLRRAAHASNSLVAVTKLSPARQPAAPDPASTPTDDKTTQPTKTEDKQ